MLDAFSFKSKDALAERQTLFKMSTIGFGGKAPDEGSRFNPVYSC